MGDDAAAIAAKRFKRDEALIAELERTAIAFDRDKMRSTADLLRRASARIHELSLRNHLRGTQ